MPFPHSLSRSLTFALVLSANLFLLMLVLAPASGKAQQLYLNEVMASNGSNIEDEDLDAEPWIELYYTGDEPLHLEGYGLSDDYDSPFQWEFPDVSIEPGTFMLVWASGKDRSDPGGELHTNFRVSMAGEEVLITAPDGDRIDELSPTEIPTDISLGRQPDGTGDWHFFNNPTPGGPNDTKGYQEMLEPVNFSEEGGFYTDEFELHLTHPDPGADIIYTLDGSEPDPGNIGGTTYEHMDRYRSNNQQLITKTYETLEYDDSDPLTIYNRTDEPNYFSRMQTAYEDSPDPYYFPSDNVFKGTVVRAKAIKEGGLSDKAKTKSYFVTPEGRDRYSLPVISLAVQEDYLFDYESGMYVPGKIFDDRDPDGQADGGSDANYHQRGIEWEFPATMELFDRDSERADLEQHLGLRLHGGWSRAFTMKSLRLYARNRYGDNRFYHRMFPGLPYDNYNRLMLRNSGNDYQFSLFRDAAIQKVVKHMNFDTQAYRPFIVLINGEYWGIHNLRERYDEDYLSRTYDLDDENLDILEHNAIVKEGSNDHYHETMDYLRQNDITRPEHYEYLQTRIDTENYIDYQVAQIYAGNTDWPCNNIDFWRYQTDEYRPDAPKGQDGRWRWLLYDTDFGFALSYGSSPDDDVLRHALGEISINHCSGGWATELFSILIENETFRNDFINRYADQLNTGFQSGRAEAIIDELADGIVSEIPEMYERWSEPNHLDNWHGEVGTMRNYVNERPGHARRHIRNRFDLPGEADLTVDVSDPSEGRVKVNSIEITSSTAGIDSDPLPWTGSYFRDIPITLEAKPWPGYEFSHWEDVDADASSPEIELTLSGSESVTAVFAPAEDPGFFPEPHALSEDAYSFTRWGEVWGGRELGDSFPENMAFVYMDQREPGLDAGVDGFTSGVYNLESRTRINALAEDGFAFINTSNEDGNPGYPGTKLGGAILALNTTGESDVEVSWTGKTVEPNSRIYNLRLQYRLGDEGDFGDVLDENGQPVEYRRSEEAGHSETIGPVALPEVAENKAYVQLLWRYYYTGERVDEDSGQRSKMAVSEINVGQELSPADNEESPPQDFNLHQNYPNPFNPATVISYDLPEGDHVYVGVYDITGRHVTTLMNGPQSAGSHELTFNAGNLSSGVYIYRIETDNYSEVQKMLLVK